MYTCTSCGCAIPENRRFCPECGAMITKAEGYSPQESPSGYSDDFDFRDSADNYEYSQEIQRQSYQSSSGGEPHYSSSSAYGYSSNSREETAVLSTGQFFLSLFLMLLPGIGLIIQIIWACGAAKNRNRVNLARAFLIWTIISVIITVISVVILYMYAVPYLESMGFFELY